MLDFFTRIITCVRTIAIQRERPGQSAQIPSKVRSRRTLELRAAELELVAEA